MWFNNLRAEMTRNRMTIAKTAEAIGISPSALSKRLNGKTEFRFLELSTLARIFDVSLEYLANTKPAQK